MTARSQWLDLLVIAAIGLASLLPFIGQTRDLSSREIRHAEIAREMAVSGDFLVPTLLGRPYCDKPPVLHAAVAMLYRLAGEPSLALARLPSVAAAVLSALALYGIGLVLADRRTALFAALAVLGLQGFSRMARVARPDMIFALGFLIACWGLVRAMRQSRGTLAWCTLGGLGCGLAVLTKGPLGLLFPVLFGVLAPIRRDDLRRPGAAAWAVFAAAALATALLWAVPVYLRDGGAYLHRVVFQPDLNIEVGTGSHSFWWYFKVLPVGWLPLTLLVPWVVMDARRRGWSAALGVAAVMFVVLCCIPKKRLHYLLPLYPLLALATIETVMRHVEQRWLLRAAQALVAVSLVSGPFYYGLIQPRHTPPEEPELAFAREVLRVVPPGAPIICFGDLGEPIAFVGRRGNVTQVGGLADLVASLQHGGEYVVAPQVYQETIRLQLAGKWAMREVFAGDLMAGGKSQRWVVLQAASV
ncbi:MAG: glycosyltransferase family 39 protein [Verrucomicrobiae bacterium]|nr:glycosyltransferase family 39 protein [Verrucomicrobiae bacterium]